MARITMREAISQALMEEMDRDPAVFIMGEEVGVWGGTYAVTKGFYDKYGPERVKDTPIAENAIIGGAIGAAMVGQRPIAELMTINFGFSAMDYIVNQAPKLRYMFGGQFEVPMVIRAVGGGGRQLGATHSQTPDAIFAHFPGLVVVSPGTPADAKGLLKSAIRSNEPPCTRGAVKSPRANILSRWATPPSSAPARMLPSSPIARAWSFR